MKLPKAKKLPSGSWNINVMVDGKRVSVTRPTEKECVAAAAAIKAGMNQASKPRNLTVGMAIDRYIELKSPPVLSPTTISEYKRIRKNDLQEIMNINLADLTQEKIQRAVNKMAEKKSPKSVRNAHGLLSATLDMFLPEFRLRTALPQKRKPEIRIPNEDEIKVILQNCVGTNMELPILLAIWMGLRASEIAGLTWSCIDGNYIHIKQAMVQDENGTNILKTTKTTSGDRYILAPNYILDLINQQPHKDDFIVHYDRRQIYRRWVRLLKKWGLPHYRFHDLRHASASVSLMLGIPDKYSMQRMGHSTDNMLKTTYQHTLRQKEDQYAGEINKYFEEKLQMKLQMKNTDA